MKEDLDKITEEIFEEEMQKLMNSYQVHLAFYLATLKKFKLLDHQERKELKVFLHVLLKQLAILDMEEEDAELEKEERVKQKKERRCGS